MSDYIELETYGDSRFRLQVKDGKPANVQWHSTMSGKWYRCTHHTAQVAIAVWWDRQQREMNG